MELKVVFGFRAKATDYGLRADYVLPQDSALDRITGLRIIREPGKICIRPGRVPLKEWVASCSEGAPRLGKKVLSRQRLTTS
eukprot:6224740-Alexandrium_andersonii.AAC.1